MRARARAACSFWRTFLAAAANANCDAQICALLSPLSLLPLVLDLAESVFIPLIAQHFVKTSAVGP